MTDTGAGFGVDADPVGNSGSDSDRDGTETDGSVGVGKGAIGKETLGVPLVGAVAFGFNAGEDFSFSGL